MWTGGVRVIVLDSKKRMLLVKQSHKERDVWMCPGGGIEDGEYAIDAAIREIKEETNLDIKNCIMISHIEEVSHRGQRFVNVFMAEMVNPDDTVKLGYDPEFDKNEQVLSDIRFVTRDEIKNLSAVYPSYIVNKFWDDLESGKLDYNAYVKREDTVL